MAYNGMAYWSLAMQGLVYVLINTLIVWYFSPWRPTLKNINFSPLRSMFKFSFKILATSITTHVNNNILNIMLGHYFSSHATGIYNQAYQWNSKCFMLAQNMVNQVAQPMLVDLKDEENRQLLALRKLMRFTSFVSFPLLLGFGMVAKEFIVVSITAKWLDSAELIQILCFSGATIPLSTLLSNMIISKGKSNIYFLLHFRIRSGSNHHYEFALGVWNTCNGDCIYLIKHRMVICLVLLYQSFNQLFALELLGRCSALWLNGIGYGCYCLLFNRLVAQSLVAHCK